MLERNNGRITSVAWTEICPWLVIFRSFRLAVSARYLIIAAVGVLATMAGWCLIGQVFSGFDDAHLQDGIASITCGGVCPCKTIAGMASDSPGCPTEQAGNAITLAWKQLSEPFRRMLQLDVSWLESIFWLSCGLWAVFVWSFAGGAITRSAAVALAADEKPGLAETSRFVLSRWGSYFAAPLFPLLGVLLVTIPILILGLLLRSYATAWVAGLFWILALAGGLFSAVLMLYLMFGWPLMWATISSEGSDCFDAMSRSYAYVFQRPLHYLFYAIVAAVLGVLGWILVMNFAAGVIYLAYWSAGWGAGGETVSAIAGGKASGGGVFLLHIWTGCVKILAVGYLYSYFWTAATAIYLVLRRDVDATEMDEVFLEGAAESDYGLPKVGVDEKGAPVVEDGPAEEKEP